MFKPWEVDYTESSPNYNQISHSDSYTGYDSDDYNNEPYDIDYD